MEGVLKDALSSQPILQVFAGAVALIVVAYMVMRGTKDRESTPAASPTLPAPAPGGISDVPSMFAQGPQEMMNTFRQMREDVRTIADNGRRIVEEIKEVREDVQNIKADGHRRTTILEQIEREQAVANRSAHPGRQP
jgi:hypothetical protein